MVRGEAIADAGVAAQLARVLRCTVLRQIGRGAHHQITLGRAEGDADHLLGQQIAIKERGIVTIFNQPGHQLLLHYLHLHPRIAGQIVDQHRCQQAVDGAARSAELESPYRLVAVAGQLAKRLFQGIEGGEQLLEQPLARFGRYHGAGAAVEQPYPQTGFQPLQAVAEGGGGDPEFEGGLAETAVTSNGGKYRQFGEIGTGNGHHQSTKRRESQGYAKAVLHTIRTK